MTEQNLPKKPNSRRYGVIIYTKRGDIVPCCASCYHIQEDKYCPRERAFQTYLNLSPVMCGWRAYTYPPRKPMQWLKENKNKILLSIVVLSTFIGLALCF
jgi:hypothetical protein